MGDVVVFNIGRNPTVEGRNAATDRARGPVAARRSDGV